MRRRQLRKQWRKASNEEKEGLKPLWEEAKKTLASLRRAERIRKRRRRKEKERSSFFKNPFKHARRLLEDKRSGKLDITQSELENHIREQYSDPARSTPLGSPGYVPLPAPPSFLFDAALPKLSEVAEVVRKARAASAPGPNGIPYKLYKYCPGVLKHLWKLLRVAWKNQVIPSEWQRAVTVLIPKEANSTTISQFRSIALLNIEGKIFFSILAKRLTNYLTSNGYIDTSCQKAGVPGFPGCVEHSAVIWEQIQKAKRERGDPHVVWLDLANA
ncbi:LINE-1 retrotransposable element ORF2 protein [Merluccius polli]|uniref:LINE-1 retrotransposable element ORF2 protein n=1 Tax=Merluccius polli TaxID=89951 RepID=A0AA47M4R3_MERPO|nr:LINE-1 retrotransposable element ORF2 protein [Merluccius polli]